jgi:subtilisin family serine protease
MRRKLTALLLAVLVGTVFFIPGSIPGSIPGRVHVLSTMQPAQAAASYSGLQWNLHALHVRQAWHFAPLQGAGVTICSPDTGVSANAADLQGAIAGGTNTEDMLHPDSWADDEGHGTFIASEMVGRGVQVWGIAPQANLLSVKVFDSTGSGSDTAIVAAIFWCVAHGASVINFSLGGIGDQYSGLYQGIKYACSHNVAIAVAEGNDSTDESADQPADISSPCLIDAIATDPGGYITTFSNWGENHRAVAAPGGNVLGDTPGGSVTYMSGTSMAAPEIAGGLALLMAQGASAADAVAIIEATAKQPPVYRAHHWTLEYGFGDANLGAAMKLWATG